MHQPPTHQVSGWGEPSRHGELSSDAWAGVSCSFAPHIHPQSSLSPPLGWASSHWGRRRKLVNYKRRGLGGQAAPHRHPLPDAIYTVSWLWGHRVRPQPPLTCAASCGERGGRSGRKPARRGGTGTAGALCACGSGGSAHRSGQISSHILPRCSGRASRLQRRGGVSGLVRSHPPLCLQLCATLPSTLYSRGFPDPQPEETGAPLRTSARPTFPFCPPIFCPFPTANGAPLPHHSTSPMFPCFTLSSECPRCGVAPCALSQFGQRVSS